MNTLINLPLTSRDCGVSLYSVNKCIKVSQSAASDCKTKKISKTQFTMNENFQGIVAWDEDGG